MTVRKAASTASAVVGKLLPGEHAELLSSKPGWYRVELDNGKRGYVSKTWTDLIPAGPTPTPTPAPAGAWFAPPVAPQSREMNVHVIDVGQGAATLFEFPCGAALIDAGGEDTHELDGTVNLLAYLDAFFAHRPDLGGRLDLLVLTHPHKDHTKGACDVITRYKPRNLVDDGLDKPKSSGRVGQKCLQEAGGTGTPYQPVKLKDISDPAGMTSPIIDPIKCTPVDPVIRVLFGQVPSDPTSLLPGWTKTEADNENNQSVVTRIDFGSFSMLVTGDLQEQGIQELIDHSAPSGVLRVRVYEVGHHGSHNGTTTALLQNMKPEIAVLGMGNSAGSHDTYSAWAFGHPSDEAITMLTDPQNGVRRSRPAVIKPVGLKGQYRTMPPSWTTWTIDRAVYGTGWDGTIVLHANDQGQFNVLTEH